MDNVSDSSAESINGSWVKLGTQPDSRGSSHTSPNLSDGEDMEHLLADAVADHFKQPSPGDASPSPRQPGDLTTSKSKQDSVMLQWSSRPEIRRARIGSYKRHNEQSTRTSSLSFRRSKVMKSGVEIMSFNMLVILPAIVASHALFLGIGVYIGRNILCQKGK